MILAKIKSLKGNEFSKLEGNRCSELSSQEKMGVTSLEGDSALQTLRQMPMSFEND